MLYIKNILIIQKYVAIETYLGDGEFNCWILLLKMAL